jgi:hypothetical protein
MATSRATVRHARTIAAAVLRTVADLHTAGSARAMRYLTQETLAELQQVTRAFRANVLIVGVLPASHRDEILSTIQFQSRYDVFHAQSGSLVVLPNHGEVMVVLEDVCDLSRNDQNRLVEWISRHDGQIVSFASRSPYAMVSEGRFDERLYYHLNTFCIVLGEE